MTWQPRTISGTFVHPDGTPAAGAIISARAIRVAPADPTTVALRFPLATAVADAAGNASLDLVTPESGTIAYEIAITPADTPRPTALFTVHLAAGPATTFAALLAALGAAVDPDAITLAIGVHAATVATVAALGHVKVDGTTIVVDSDGIISAVGGGGGGGGVSDHGLLAGLTADDHPQYLTASRGDARYYTEAEADALLAAKASAAALTAHTSATSNPHSVTAAQVGAPTTGALAAETSARTAADAALTDALADHAALTTDAHGGMVADDDARLSDARTPTAHASSHGSAGSDPIAPADIDAAAASHSHTEATSSAAGFLSAADKSKLDGIASGATANATDAQLRDRSTHTGSQPASSISDLAEAVDDRVASLLTAGTNITLSYDDGAGTLTIDAAGGVADGDKGDIVVSGSGATWSIDPGVLTSAGRALASAADAAAQRGALGLGTAATQAATSFVSATTPWTANTVLAGPASGAAAAPTPRALVAADLPTRPAAVVPLIMANVSSVSWTSQPAAAQEFGGGGIGRRLRRRADLTGNTRCRLSGYATNAGPAGCVWGVEYTLDLTGASGWTALGAAGTAVQIPMDATSGDAPIVGSMVNLAAAAQTDVLLRVVGSGGNGSASPSVASLLLELLP